MLTMTNNLDRTDEASISNWPFTYESTLDTGNGILPADSFLAVTVNVDETVELPCRFKGITDDGYLVICDAGGNDVCKGKLFDQTAAGSEMCSFFLYNQYNVLTGAVFCKPDVPQKLFALSKYANRLHYFGASAFVLLPQCHMQSVVGNVRAFGINGNYRTADTQLRCSLSVPEDPGTQGFNIVPDGNLVNGIAFSVFNIEPFTRNKWCEITVWDNGSVTTYKVADHHLILKSSMTSNLRVTDTDAMILLKGVQDAQ